MEFILRIINDNFPAIIAAFATIITTLITIIGNKIIKKEKISPEVYKESLVNVYLPLHKIFFLNKESKKTNDYKTIIVKNNIENIEKILDKEYLFFSPLLPQKLYKLIEETKNDNKKFKQKYFNDVCEHINTDYEHIKKQLGYPEMSSIQKFYRCSIADKCKIFKSLLYKCLLTILCFMALLIFFMFIFANMRIINFVKFIAYIAVILFGIFIFDCIRNC